MLKAFEKLYPTEQLSPPLKRFRLYPEEYGDLDQKNEIFMDLKSPAELDHGSGFATGVFAILAALFVCLLGFIFDSDTQLLDKLKIYSVPLGIAVIIGGISTLVERGQSLPPPTRFNRRTREVYALDSQGRLYHAPWDSIIAQLSWGKTVLRSGPMSFAGLTLRLHFFGGARNVLEVPLGMALGTTKESKLRLWEYVCTYMDQGPDFETAESASLKAKQLGKVLEELDSEYYRPAASRAELEAREQAANASLDTPYMRAILWITKHNFLFALWDWSNRRARSRPRAFEWPPEVLERCRPDGPTNQLVDIELEPEVRLRVREQLMVVPTRPTPVDPEVSAPKIDPDSPEARIAAHQERIRARRAAKKSI